MPPNPDAEGVSPSALDDTEQSLEQQPPAPQTPPYPAREVTGLATPPSPPAEDAVLPTMNAEHDDVSQRSDVTASS